VKDDWVIIDYLNQARNLSFIKQVLSEVALPRVSLPLLLASPYRIMHKMGKSSDRNTDERKRERESMCVWCVSCPVKWIDANSKGIHSTLTVCIITAILPPSSTWCWVLVFVPTAAFWQFQCLFMLQQVPAPGLSSHHSLRPLPPPLPLLLPPPDWHSCRCVGRLGPMSPCRSSLAGPD
jgi:hypothetical protein